MSHQSNTGITALVDTRFKKTALAVFIATNVGMVAVPASLASYGASQGWTVSQIAFYSSIGFVVNEVFLFGSAACLGKPIVILITAEIKRLFKQNTNNKKGRKSDNQ
ncbi:hypothetical protein [Agarivorans sp. Alg241-V36]|uniref:hypothetical protein n=1 Tax=Agarivorans sp. Alg241-V36 TaxID=2305992 RepID=UPI0013D09055|nr:hypothetical protein [Agarivorans sp. Alg241-V36]